MLPQTCAVQIGSLHTNLTMTKLCGSLSGDGSPMCKKLWFAFLYTLVDNSERPWNMR